MVIATFGPSTAWLGKTINFENGQFVLEGHGPISASSVLEYDRGGYLTWAYAGLREWVQQVAALPQAQPSASIQTGKGGKQAPKKHRASGMIVGVPAAGASRKKTSGWLVVGYVTIAVALLFIAGASWWLIQDSRSPATTTQAALPTSTPSASPSPAAVVVTSLEADRTDVSDGGVVTVAAEFANMGGVSGTYTASLKVNGKVVAKKRLTVPAGRGDSATFKVKLRGDRTHKISLGDRSVRVRSLPTVRYPTGYVMRWDLGHGPSKLTIKNWGASDGVVILATPTKKPQTKVAIYVRGKSTAVVRQMPSADFHIYCVLGSGWSPKLKRFVAVHSCEGFWDNNLGETYYFDFSPATNAAGSLFYVYTISLTTPYGDAEPIAISDDKMPSLE